MSEPISLDQAATVMREAMRDAIKKHSTWYLVQGVLMVLAGAFALIFPVFSSVAFIVMLGWLLIISGVVQGISLIGASNVPHFWLQMVSTVLSIVVGFLFLRHPGEGLFALTLLLVVFLIVGGMSKVIFALTIRPFTDWGWILASGIVGIVLGILLWSNMPVTAAWLLGVFVGIQLVCEGAALGMMAWNVRKS